MRAILAVFIALSLQTLVFGATSWNALLHENLFSSELDSSRSRSGHSAVLVKEFSGLLEDQNVVDQLYANYLSKHSKNYALFDSASSKSGLSRSEIFKSNLISIISHNLEVADGKHKWFQSVNQFTDITDEEFESFYTGLSVNITASLAASGIPQVPLKIHLNSESEKDWREDGVVTKVKNQEQCGSCYAFTTCAALESQLAMQGTKDLDLSEQELVDCSKNNGCGGGDWPPSYTYMKNGVTTEAAYPYRSGRSGKAARCASRGKRKVAYVGSYSYVPNDEDSLTSAVVESGPLAVGVSTKNWNRYGGGVFDSDCGTSIGHAVLLVGVKDGNYIIKNSWGEGWGEDGYILLPVGINQCMVKDDACVMSPK